MRVVFIEGFERGSREPIQRELTTLAEAGFEVHLLCATRNGRPIPNVPTEVVYHPLEPPQHGWFKRTRLACRLAVAAWRLRGDFYHGHAHLGDMILAALTALLRRARYYGDYNNIVILGMKTHGTLPRRPGGTFEQSSHWQAEHNAKERDRIATTLAAIPHHVQSILDIGCGDGRITNQMMTGNRNVLGIDSAFQGLKYLKSAGAQGDIVRLPLADRAVQMVIATEVIEHLPDHVLRRSLAEIQRVARDYVLISVPFNEQLENKFLRCPIDGHRFNINGHYQSFSIERLRSLLPAFELVQWNECGGPVPYYQPLLRLIRQHIGGVDVRIGTIVCPQCQYDLFPTGVRERNAISSWCDGLNKRQRLRRTGHLSHVVALYRRIRNNQTPDEPTGL